MNARVLVGAALALAVLVHLGIIFSIAGQPFNVNQAPPSSRSCVWPLFNDSAHRIGPFADFFAVYQGGIFIREGRDPYTMRIRPTQVPYFYIFRYLPVVAYSLGAALSFLPARFAAHLWILLLEMILATLLVLYWRQTRPLWLRLFGVSLLLLCTPYFLEVHMGQFTFGTLALTGIALLLLEGSRDRIGRREWLAILCYTVAVLMKVFPLILAPALLRRGRVGRICLLIAVGAAVLLNAPFFLKHPITWTHYLDRNFSPAAVWDGLNPGNFGLVYLLHIGLKQLGVNWSQEGWVLFVQIWRFLVLGAAAGIVFFSAKKDLLLGSCALILAHFAAFHHVWEHHISGAMVIGLLLLYSAAKHDGEMPRRQIVWMSLALVLMAMPTPFFLLDRHFTPQGQDPADTFPFWARLLVPLFKVAPMATLLIWAVRRLLQAGWNLPPRGRDLRSPRLPVILGTLLAGLMVLNPRPCLAQGFFADLRLGKSRPARADLRIDQGDQGNLLVFHQVAFRDESFQDPPWYGLRIGRWWGRSERFGLALELVHAKLYIEKDEFRRMSGVREGSPVDTILQVGDRIQQFSLSHGENFAFLDLLLRQKILSRAIRVRPKPVPSTGIPSGLRPRAPEDKDRKGLVHLFAGAGVGPVITHAENRVDELQNRERYRVSGLGWQILAGLLYTPNDQWGLHCEYKRTGADLEIDLHTGKATLGESSHHLCAGVTLYWKTAKTGA